jgi:hypothetical protein
MSVASALNPLMSEASDPNSKLAHRCLYYMKMMREMEDRIERKLACLRSRKTHCSRPIGTWRCF